ncbi:hypothetical protein UCDDA912_g09764 [Diaporthe ampelina]|uniref:Uncharacterized protein n=1 Tax=Diaporthe ampelina TaxID=1214573 RepID=A0A0G2F7X2_9PEZI|nr:hypothetical protein UCDDA912_g09764 [Diaporthe ampelina]
MCQGLHLVTNTYLCTSKVVRDLVMVYTRNKSGLIRNTNKNKLIRATFPVQDGEAVADGPFAIDGVAGTVSKITIAFQSPSGSKTGKTLPVDQAVDTFDGVRATCIEVGSPCMSVPASELGVDVSILADDGTQSAGLDPAPGCGGDVPRKGHRERPRLDPNIIMVSAPREHKFLSGETLDEKSWDVVVRAISVGQLHHAVSITVAMALATASRLPGSTVNECVT